MSDTQQKKNNKYLIGYDFGSKDYGCLVYGKKLKNGRIKVTKIVYTK